VKNGKKREDAEKNFDSNFQGLCRDEYEAGNLTDREAIRMLVAYGGKTEMQATSKVQYWDFKQRNPDTSVEDSWFETYNEDIADYGISIDMYINYKIDVSDIVGEDKKVRRMAVINSLPISASQKDALYFAEGWSASTIYEAPWR
jgi:hypothetical protein